jgi:purine-binding chemotaxis protein CheW
MTRPNSHNESIKALPDVVGTYLTFMIGTEEYGVDIQSVSEIVGLLPVTPVPGSPPVVLGVINLRGKVIPVLSMRILFNLGIVEATKHNVFIIIENDAKLIGLSVDQVREVASFTKDDIEPPPNYGLGIDAAYVRAIGKSEGKIRMLLDIKRVLDLHSKSN